MWTQIFLAALLALFLYFSNEFGVLYNTLNVYVMLTCVGMVAWLLVDMYKGQWGVTYWAKNYTHLGYQYWLALAIKITYFLLIAVYTSMRLPKYSFSASEYQLIITLIWVLPVIIVVIMALPAKYVNWPHLLVMALFSVFLSNELLRFEQREHQDAVVLSNPFKHDAIVEQGGASQLFNHHYKIDSQRWALDMLFANENPTKSMIDKTTLSDFACFSAPIYAPVSGEVVAIQTSLPDMQLGQSDPVNLAGNYVVIKSASKYVMLAHLKQHSSPLKLRQSVIEGQTLLGQCGNSGNTTEPHLHIQVQDHDDFKQVTRTYPIYFKTPSGTVEFKRANDKVRARM